jgi:hypothetical protein
MVVNISFSNKTFYLLVGILVILVSFGIVYAYGGSQPAVMGHSFGEIDMPDCATGEALVKTSTGWGCENVGSGVTDSGRIVGGGQKSLGIYGSWICSSWGNAFCSGNELECPNDSTNRIMGSKEVATMQEGMGSSWITGVHTTEVYYLCVTD